jgi:DNA mismatch endonuclease (patch repair protein)
MNEALERDYLIISKDIETSMPDYVRDKRSPSPSSEAASRNMRANKAKDTNPEILVRRELRAIGVRNYRIHMKGIPGRPDIAFPSKRLAIFINGCFWHRCPRCNLPIPKSNAGFWKEKFERNVDRDLSKKTQLEKEGWRVLTIWECEVKEDISGIIVTISRLLRED